MALSPLPGSSDALADASWPDIEAVYQALADAPLGEPAAIESWLAYWSRWEELVSEAASLAMIRYTCDTEDAEKEAAHLRWSTTILPQAEERSVALARRLVDTGYTRPDLAFTLRRFRTAIGIFREENVPLMADLEQESARYQRITGGMLAEWNGEKLPLPRLAPFIESRDREVRERAWRAATRPYVDARDDLADLFDGMVERRQTIARNAGFSSYRDYVFPAKYRFDYTPADCERFHDAIEATVVPALDRLRAERGQRLGVAPLRPWDLGPNPYADTPLKPYASIEDLPRITHRIFQALDPALGEMFGTMRGEHLLDLESRKGKAPGGYCDTLQARGRPFIFMNAAGVIDDVTTLLHESGHCFHAFESHALPLLWQRFPGAEAAELASMSMELLAGAYLGPPHGFFSEADAAMARLEHLEGVLESLAHIASIDAFQHWIYTTSEGANAEARDAGWLRIRGRFERGIDWAGLDRERIARWYRQLHIFLYPFYYIEYAIAQVGALQVWRNGLRDAPAALAQYRAFLALGATRPLPELFEAAGARLVFGGSALGELVALVEEEAGRLRALVPTGVAEGIVRTG